MLELILNIQIQFQTMQSLIFSIVLMLLWINYCKAWDFQLSDSKPFKVAYSITVSKSGKANFTTIQAAIDAIPQNNKQWIKIQISPGKYQEKVYIPQEKPCIFLEGVSQTSTSIEWGDHEDTYSSATFSTYAHNVVLKGITFKNTYNLESSRDRTTWVQAVAARIAGDKTLIYKCGFLGVQDTLWHATGRHYVKESYVEGSVDFIFGIDRVLYEKSIISVKIGEFNQGESGFITAHRDETPTHASGFVFKNCIFKGVGKAYLGRAWGPYSTVIIYNSKLENVIVPEGWNAWEFVGHEANFTYAEGRNTGAGADTTKRVRWEKSLNPSKFKKFLNMRFINQDGWLGKLPVS